VLHLFEFDRILRPQHGQIHLWQEVDASVERVLFGGTACVACYGQTGSGKTHSMIGDGASGPSAGVQPRSVRFLLDQLELQGIRLAGSESLFD